MSEKTDCPLCSKTLSFAGLKKHMFSKNHSHIWNDPKLRGRLQECLNSGAKNTVQVKSLFLCFGCKTFSRKDVPHRCQNKQKAIDFLKTILDVPARKVEVVAPEPKECSGGALGASGQEEIEKLKKENERLKKEIKELEEENQDLLAQAMGDPKIE